METNVGLFGAGGGTDVQSNHSIYEPVLSVPSPGPGLHSQPDIQLDCIQVVPASVRQ